MTRIGLRDWADPSQRAKFAEIWSRPSLRLVASLLQVRGLSCLLVGGVVRDLVLDVTNDDVDLVVNGSPEQLFSNRNYLAKKSRATAVPLDRERGILRLVFGPGDELDLVSRKGESLLEDLSRRDFSLNAMALDAEGFLYDPHNGLRALEQRVLRSVAKDSFLDDPLRVVRGIRFAAQLQATIDPETLELMRAAVKLLGRVAGERVSTELRKFFPRARAADLKYLYTLDLADHLFGCRAHTEELMLELQPESFSWALATWLNDQRGEAKKVAGRLKLSKTEQRYLEHYWAGVDWTVGRQGALTLGDIYDLTQLAQVTLPDLARALQCSNYPTLLTMHERQWVLREANKEGRLKWEDFPWNGHQLAEALGRAPGPWMGPTLERARKAWACGTLTAESDLKLL